MFCRLGAGTVPAPYLLVPAHAVDSLTRVSPGESGVRGMHFELLDWIYGLRALLLLAAFAGFRLGAGQRAAPDCAEQRAALARDWKPRSARSADCRAR